MRLETGIHPEAEALRAPLLQIVDNPFTRNGKSTTVQVLGDSGEEIGAVPEMPAEDFRSLYEWMIRVRVFDTRIVNLQRQGRLAFFVPSSGEEAVQIGTAWALRPEDWVFPAYREQGVALFRGYPLPELLGQMLGNSKDYLLGRQMPDHFGTPKVRFAVASSPVGTQIPHAVGAAWSARLRGEDWVAITYFGDGATSTGDFHAGLNFAAVQQLPVVFYCKNNGWAISLPRAKQCRAEYLSDKAVGYGMPGVRVDGNDILAVYSVAKQAMEWARSGGGPVLVEMLTQRMGPHSTADDPTRYREPELLEPWKKRDPIMRFRAFLENRGLWSQADEDRAWADTEERFTAALAETESAAGCDPSTMFEDVYAKQPWHLKEQQDEILRR